MLRCFQLAECLSCANFDRSHDGFATILNLGPIGAQKGHLGPKRALLVSLEAQKRPDTRPKCAATMISTQSGQSAAVWTKSVPWGPSEDLSDPKKGHFGPKWALLVSLEAQKRPDTRPKCVATMISTQ